VDLSTHQEKAVMNMGLNLDRLVRSRSPRRHSRLRLLENFGSNPGHLQGWAFVPTTSERVPLVVALHGCTQTAEGFDSGTGWSELAARHGFAVLLPEQQRANNPNLCFNWFEPGDARRRTGEPLSIAQMIDHLVAGGKVDPERVYITGLSAGGAMTSIMLATYPEKFAGGAILAGLPHGAASSVQEAFQQMRGYTPSSRTDGRIVREAADHGSDWPAVAIWHGTADTVVDYSNAEGIVRQWQEIHGVSGAASVEDIVDGHPHRAWRDAAGRIVIEEYRVLGMGHGVPLSAAGDCACGETGAFMLEAGISSTVHSARSWSLLDAAAAALPSAAVERPVEPDQAQPVSLPVPAAAQSSASGSARARERERTASPSSAAGVGRVIEDALRAAGLMR
jgi:poly(hydroxyalkanoate) depolymerase family esterase